MASARLSPANAGVVAAKFETAPLAQADVFAGQKRDADRLERTPDRPGDSRQEDAESFRICFKLA